MGGDEGGGMGGGVGGGVGGDEGGRCGACDACEHAWRHVACTSIRGAHVRSRDCAPQTRGQRIPVHGRRRALARRVWPRVAARARSSLPSPNLAHPP
eukprot:5197673-Prymnesium_polylepis.1